MSGHVDPPWKAEPPPSGNMNAPIPAVVARQWDAPDPGGRQGDQDGGIVQVRVSPQGGGPGSLGPCRHPDSPGYLQQVLGTGPGPGHAGFVGRTHREGTRGQMFRKCRPAHAPFWLLSPASGALSTAWPPTRSARWHLMTIRGSGTVIKCHLGGHLGGGYTGWLNTCRRTQACMAIAAAEAAFMERVEPNCSMERVATAASCTSGVRPGPSCPNTRTHFLGRS